MGKAERHWWCDLGCGWEGTTEQTKEGLCPRCGRMVVDLGWFWRGNRHEAHYASDWRTVPKEQR